MKKKTHVQHLVAPQWLLQLQKKMWLPFNNSCLNKMTKMSLSLGNVSLSSTCEYKNMLTNEKKVQMSWWGSSQAAGAYLCRKKQTKENVSIVSHWKSQIDNFLFHSHAVDVSLHFSRKLRRHWELFLLKWAWRNLSKTVSDSLSPSPPPTVYLSPAAPSSSRWQTDAGSIWKPSPPPDASSYPTPASHWRNRRGIKPGR